MKKKIITVNRKAGRDYEIIESFEAESQNPVELQRNGWQSILNNFKKFAESADN